MSNSTGEGEWIDQAEYESWEVNREGDTVFLYFATVDTTQVFGLDPEDAVNVGLALAQAGQEPEETGT